jgi:hypothetical protein
VKNGEGKMADIGMYAIAALVGVGVFAIVMSMSLAATGVLRRGR